MSNNNHYKNPDSREKLKTLSFLNKLVGEQTILPNTRMSSHNKYDPPSIKTIQARFKIVPNKSNSKKFDLTGPVAVSKQRKHHVCGSNNHLLPE
jgi:hypothetical protein